MVRIIEVSDCHMRPIYDIPPLEFKLNIISSQILLPKSRYHSQIDFIRSFGSFNKFPIFRKIQTLNFKKCHKYCVYVANNDYCSQ